MDKMKALRAIPRTILTAALAIAAAGLIGITAAACGQPAPTQPTTVALTQAAPVNVTTSPAGNPPSTATATATSPATVTTSATATPAQSADAITAIADVAPTNTPTTAGAAAEAQAPAVTQQPTGGHAQQQQTADAPLSPDQIIAAHDTVMSGIYQRSVPSIVGLRVTKAPGSMENFRGVMPDDFRARSAGSGFLWDDQGHIVTNRHVVSGAERIIVVMSDGTQTGAAIVGDDADSDLAVIKIDDPDLRPDPITLGDSDSIVPGQLALAIGDPFSRGFSMTSGIISAIGRTINPGDSNFSVPRVIQHDAATNPGNSGGPLLNRKGEVVGINTQIISQTGAFSGVGLAIPINLAKLVIPALIADGRYEYPYIGIRGASVTPDLARAMDLPPATRGALVIAVSPDSAADRGDLRPSDQTAIIDGLELPIGGDIIIAIDDTPIPDMDALLAYVVERTRPGDTVIFTVLRDGEETELSITMGARPE